MLPHLSLTVLLGAAASHVTRIAGEGHRIWKWEAVATLAALLAAWVVLAYLVRLARRALDGLETDPTHEGKSDRR